MTVTMTAVTAMINPGQSTMPPFFRAVGNNDMYSLRRLLHKDLTKVNCPWQGFFSVNWAAEMGHTEFTGKLLYQCYKY